MTATLTATTLTATTLTATTPTTAPDNPIDPINRPAPEVVEPHLATAIDMLDPYQTTRRLDVSDTTLLDLVNQGTIAAYRLGDTVRFRQADVEALAAVGLTSS